MVNAPGRQRLRCLGLIKLTIFDYRSIVSLIFGMLKLSILLPPCNHEALTSGRQCVYVAPRL
jgi:hypothetical protein